MTLYDKINALYDSLSINDFEFKIVLQNDGVTPPNGKVKVGNDYIHTWNHPTLAQPTQAQLDAITE